jgi:hypothetical protein
MSHIPTTITADEFEYLVCAAMCASACGIIAGGRRWGKEHQAIGEHLAEKLQTARVEAVLNDAVAFTIGVECQSNGGTSASEVRQYIAELRREIFKLRDEIQASGGNAVEVALAAEVKKLRAELAALRDG